MKSRLARFLDNFFMAAAVWLFSAIIALYFLDKLYLVVVFATAVTLGVSMLLNVRSGRTQQTLRDKQNAELLAEYFLLHDDDFALSYFARALSRRYSVQRQDFYLRINDTIIVPYLSEPLPLKKAVYFYSGALRAGAKTIVILTTKTEKFPFSLKEKLSDIRLEIFDGLKTLRLLKSLDSLPDLEQIKKRRFAEFFKTALCPARTKHYLFSAFTLLFGAYFTARSLYFIICAAVCLTLVVLCRLDVGGRLSNKG